MNEQQKTIFIELKERSATDHAHGTACLPPTSDVSIRDNSECRRSMIDEQSIRLPDQSDSSDQSTDYDSSIEDPTERYIRFTSANRKH